MRKAVLIVEDSTIQLEMLKRLVQKKNSDALIYTAGEDKSAYKILMEKTIDVFLVDIILNTGKPGDIAGIHLVERLRQIPKYLFTPVIFITALEDVSGYAYRNLNCLGYIEKPFDADQVNRLLEKALTYSTAKETDVTICFRKEGVIYPIQTNDIVYIESINHIVRIHLANNEIYDIPYITCKQIMEENETECLIQCNRGTIVNKKYILNIDFANKYITLKSNFMRIEIGSTFRKKIHAGYEWASSAKCPKMMGEDLCITEKL